MDQHIVRDCVKVERLARSLADYYSRRTRGVTCRDLLPAQERASAESLYHQRLQSARQFVQRVVPAG